MADEAEEIVITARRLPPDGTAGAVARWSNTATYRNIVTGQTRTVTTTNDLNSQLKLFSSNDTVKVNFDIDGKNLTVVFSNLNGRNIQTAFQNFFSVITSTLDGTLIGSINEIRSTSQRNNLLNYVNELKGDLESAASSGKYVNIVGDTTTGTNYGIYKGTRSGGIDINNDGLPDQYHLISVNPNLIGTGINDRLSVTLVHEMFHMLEGDGTTLDTDYTRFGVTEATHTNAYDKAAIQLSRLVSRKAIEITSYTDGGAIQGIEGSTGNDVLAMSAGYRGSFIDGYAGNDAINASFSNSVLDGGDGNDIYTITGGDGRLTILDSSGFDVLDFGASIQKSQLRVRRDGSWIEIGIDSTGSTNSTTVDLSNVIIIPSLDYASNPIDEVRIGGMAFTMQDILLEADNAPFLTSTSEYSARSTFRGGSLGSISARDIDNDSISYSIISKQGYASTSGWYIDSGKLYANATAPRGGGTSNIIVRVSDGRKYTDTSIKVSWAPYSDVSTDRHPANANLSMDAYRLAEAISSFDIVKASDVIESRQIDYADSGRYFAGESHISRVNLL